MGALQGKTSVPKLPVCLLMGKGAEQIHQMHLSCSLSVCFDVTEAWREASLV